MAKAGNAVIGALKVVLGADTAAFEKGLKSAQSALGRFGKGVNKPMAAFSAAIAGAATTLAVGLKLAINRADEMGKAAQKFGIPVEQLSALAHAADLADVSFEALGVGLKKFSTAISSNAPQFAALGINLKDGLQGTDERLLQVADAFAAMQDGANKTALSLKFFGKSGAELIPLLNEGSAGIRGMMQEAKELGLVISRDTADAADSFNDSLTRLSKISAGVFLTLAKETAGPLADFTAELVAITKQGNLASGAVDIFRGALGFLPNVLIFVNDELSRFTLGLSYYSKIANILSGDDISDDFEQIAVAGNVLSEQLKELTERTKAQYEAQKKMHEFGLRPGAQRAEDVRGPTGVVLGAGKDTGPSEDDIAKAERLREEFERQQKAVADLVKALELEAAQLGQTALAQELATNIAEAGTAATEKQIAAITRATQAIAGNKVFEDVQKPLEKYRFEMTELTELLAVGAINAETFERAVKQLREELDPAFIEVKALLEDIGQAIETTITNAIDDLIDKTFTWRDALASTLRLAAGILSGVGQRSIQNAGGWGSIFGFAQGGTFTVGGAGGIDSQLVQFMATPGETVTVSNEDAGVGFAFAPVTNVDARGSDMSESRLKAILDQRDQMWRQALPGAFKHARIQGKV